MAEWNLARLAEALLPFHDEQEQAVALAVESLGAFRPQYEAAWSAGMRAKLGLPGGLDDAAPPRWSMSCSACFRQTTSTTRRSSGHLAGRRGDTEPARELVPRLAAFDAWAERWRALGPDGDAMDRANPVYIPATTLSRRPSPPRPTATWIRSNGCWRPSPHPIDERPGLER